MAVCPKCGTKLRLWQWRPECPACGVNVIYYNANDRLLAETEQAEIEHAKSQPRIDRAKAAFFGSVPAVVRLVLSVLPIGALFLPLGRLISQEYVETVNAMSVFGYLKERGAAALSGALRGELLGLSLGLLLLSAVMILVCVICLPMSLGRHGKARNLILNLVMLGSAVGAAACFAAGGGGFFPAFNGARLSYGAFVYLALLAAILLYNLVLAKKGLRIRRTPCLIGGLPSEEYFAMKARGASELEIRKKMVAALTEMQEEVRAEAAAAERAEAEKRAAWK